MPLFWIIVLALGGATAAYAYAKAPPFPGSNVPGPYTSPSGKIWPGGITSAQEMRAVQIALSRENDPNKLEAFASILERYDIDATRRLRTKAREIELVRRGILVKFNPNQVEPLR